jgi:amino acid adenylation domain-containing protein
MKATPVDYDPFADGALARTLRATEAQKEIWAATQLGEDASCAFNESLSIHLRGELQTDALKLAIERLVLRHEALRTTFTPDGELLCVLETVRPVIVELDVSGEPDPEAALQAYCRQAVESPFDLEHGPLFRPALVRMAGLHHVLVITAHHIVFDGWSAAVVVGELGRLYDELCGSGSGPLPPAPRYAEYVAFLEGQDLGAAKAYWTGQFAGTLPAFELPLDQARPAFRTFRSRRIDHLFDSPLTAGLGEAARACRASLVVTLFSAWMAYLHRITGAGDLVTGMPAAGQNASGMQGLVGHCVNLLPIRVTVSPDLTFDALVARVRDRVLDAVDHQLFTYGSLLQALTIPRDPSRIPLVPVQFNLDPVGIVAEGFSDLDVRVLNNPRSFENFELFFNLTKVPEGIRVECQFNADLFDDEGIEERLLGFEALLRGVVANPQTPIARLPVMSPAWRERLISSWNATDAGFDLAAGADALIAAQCRATPEAVAVMGATSTLSYDDLETRVGRLATLLRVRGIGRGDLVGIALERDADMVVSALAAWRLGAAYVPLDPEFPPERLKHMLEDAGLAVVVSTFGIASSLPLDATPTVLFDREADQIAASPPMAGTSLSRPDDLAYMIYTSGSTGKPKGVRVLHRNVVNFLRSMAERPGLRPGDVLVAVTTLSFDISVLELFLPLTVGACTLVASTEQTRDGEALAALLTDSGATLMQATPATWRMLVESDWRPTGSFTALCGGEALPGELAERLIERVDRVFNMYGPTETTVWSAVHAVQSAEPITPIGTPIHNTQIYVLSDAMEPMPVGVTGELYIGGVGVTAGYHHRDDLTRERFVPSPFLPDDPSQRLYRTGDLARWRRDGILDYLGRIDAQVKVRGFRIELGEVESALLSHPEIREAVAGLYEPVPGDTRLVAYYVTEGPTDLPVHALREHLAGFLPAYMLPQHFMRLEHIPLTPNRKADRKALPAPAPVVRRELVAPRTEAEVAVADVWRRVLGLTELSVSDDFFELGGHSILATRVIARLRDELGIQLPLRRLFENPRLDSLAGHVATLMALREASSDVGGGDREEMAF